jgi:cellulose synthase operon protein C
VTHARAVAWARGVAVDVARQWVPRGAGGAWAEVLARLASHAVAIGDRHAAATLDDLSVERTRPLRLAVVGEFNAGKSTFINALLGAVVAKVGIVPTTAELHSLRWGPLEVVDTPGFNSLDPAHADVARSTFEQADIALWVLDATQALKETERAALEDAQRRGLPFLIVVNKADRLAPEDLRTVLRNLEASLAGAGLTPWAIPWAVSAKKALAGKLGDAPALEVSGWRAVESVFETALISRSGDLKERALRRRALSVTLRLLEAWTARASLEQDQSRQAAERRRSMAHSATRLEAEENALAERVAQEVTPVAAVLERDMRLVSAGRDRESAASDPALRRYRTNRAVAEIAPALRDALARLEREGAPALAREIPASGIDASLRALVRGAFARCEPEAALDDPPTLVALARGALSTWVEHLLVLASEPAPAERATGVARELSAFADALAADLPNGAARALH